MNNTEVEKRFNYENLCNMINFISCISVIIFLVVQLIYYILYFTGILEFLFPASLEELFMGLLTIYLFGTFIFLLLYPFWIIFNIILEIIRIIKFVRKNEKIKFRNMFKIIICCILYIFVWCIFFTNIF